jgi:hypothetical protein
MRNFIIVLISVAAFMFTSCDSGNKTSGGDTSGFKVTISNVEDLPAEAAKIVAAVDAGEEFELASADIENGGATLELPAIESLYLSLFNDDAPAELVFTDPAVKCAGVYFKIYDSSNVVIGNIWLVNDTTEAISNAQLMYADRPCTVSGTYTEEDEGDTITATIDLRLTKGYNWTNMAVTYGRMNWTSGIPSGAGWRYYETSI